MIKYNYGHCAKNISNPLVELNFQGLRIYPVLVPEFSKKNILRQRSLCNILWFGHKILNF